MELRTTKASRDWKRRLWSQKGRAELEKLELLPWAGRRRKELLEWLDRLDEQVRELDRAVEEAGRARPEVALLRTHPGVGMVVALAFVLNVGPIERFAHSHKLVSYWGLNPREHSSGGRQRLGAISKQGNSMMRWLLIEAAQTAARFDPQLRRIYQRLKSRRNTGVAKLAIARRLAVRFFWMLRRRHNYATINHQLNSCLLTSALGGYCGVPPTVYNYSGASAVNYETRAGISSHCLLGVRARCGTMGTGPLAREPAAA